MRNIKGASAITGALIVLATTQAHALGPENWPRLKPGMVEMNMTMDGKKMPSHKMCITQDMMKDSEKMGKEYQKKTCSKESYHQQGNVFYAEMTCKSENGKETKIVSESTLISDSQMHSKTTTTSDGKVSVMESDVKRIGDCTKESNVITGPDGKQIDINKMMEQMKKNKNMKP
jgi:hypothetical protein